MQAKSKRGTAEDMKKKTEAQFKQRILQTVNKISV